MRVKTRELTVNRSEVTETFPNKINTRLESNQIKSQYLQEVTSMSQLPPKYKDNPKDVEEFLLTTTTTGTPLTYRDVRNFKNDNTQNIDTQMDDLLSKELLGLSLQDRNAIPVSYTHLTLPTN